MCTFAKPCLRLSRAGVWVCVVPQPHHTRVRFSFRADFLSDGFHDCSALSDSEGMKFHFLTCLKELHFEAGVGFTDSTFAQGLGCPTMESLEIEWSPLTDAGLASLADHHRRLRKPDLSNCHSITDEGFRAFLQEQPHLVSLEIYQYPGLYNEYADWSRDVSHKTKWRFLWKFFRLRT